MAQDKVVYNLWTFEMTYEKTVMQAQFQFFFLVSLTILPLGHLLSFSFEP